MIVLSYMLLKKKEKGRKEKKKIRIAPRKKYTCRVHTVTVHSIYVCIIDITICIVIVTYRDYPHYSRDTKDEGEIKVIDNSSTT